MVNYSFPISSESTGLTFSDQVSYLEMNERKLSDLKDVLYKNQGLDFDCSIYKMYRGVTGIADKEIFKDIRHDITNMPPGTLNGEFVKTYGHYHPKVKNIGYPEVYQIINGRAVFVLQDDYDDLKQVNFIFAKAPEIVIVPPDLGHVVINIASDNLIFSNLIFSHFQSLYEPYQRKKGAAYYITEGSPLQWLVNSHYTSSPQPKLLRPKTIWDNQFIYDLFKNNPANFQFLAEPQSFQFSPEEIFEEKNITDIYQDLTI
jgi:glucose-6-phosphate isomerase